MAQFEFLYWLSPEGPFGIPEPGITVLPGGRQNYVGDAFDTYTGRKVSHGMQSVARWPEDKVQLEFEINDGKIQLDDNYLHITVVAESHEAASAHASVIFKRFLAAFCFHNSQFFQARLVQATRDGTLLPEMMWLAKVTIYSLDRIRNSASAAAQWSRQSLRDRRLGLALEYFNRALYLRLSQMEARLDLPFLWGASSLLGEAFLNYWKAITSVLGDPVQEGRRFQSFYKKIGLNRDFMLSEIERLKEIRNDYDVAHSLKETAPLDLNITDVDINLAERCAKRVIEDYQTFLEGQSSTD